MLIQIYLLLWLDRSIRKCVWKLNSKKNTLTICIWQHFMKLWFRRERHPSMYTSHGVNQPVLNTRMGVSACIPAISTMRNMFRRANPWHFWSRHVILRSNRTKWRTRTQSSSIPELIWAHFLIATISTVCKHLAYKTITLRLYRTQALCRHNIGRW